MKDKFDYVEFRARMERIIGDGFPDMKEIKPIIDSIQGDMKKLKSKYIGFVEKIVDVVYEEYLDVPLTDDISRNRLLKEAWVGFEHASCLYDTKADFSFQCYAMWWIRLYVIKAIESENLGFEEEDFDE